MDAVKKRKSSRLPIKQFSQFIPITILVFVVSLGFFSFKTGFIQIAGINDSAESTPILQPALQPTPTPTYTPFPTPPTQPSPTTKIEEQQKPQIPKQVKISGSRIFNLINAYRVANGKPGWNVSDQLCKLAQVRANVWVENLKEAIAVTETTGAHWLGTEESKEEIRRIGYSGTYDSENICTGPKTEEDCLRIWQASPPHNAALLQTEGKGIYEGIPVTVGCVAVAEHDYSLGQAIVVILLSGDK